MNFVAFYLGVCSQYLKKKCSAVTLKTNCIILEHVKTTIFVAI